jgi:hypothetical protein
MQSINLKNIPIYFINLDSDINRKESFLSWTSKLNFKDPTRVPAIKSDEYFIGLAEAQYNAIRLGIESGVPFIIMEDDATPNYEDENYVIEIPDDTDAVYLGASMYGVDKLDPTAASYGAEFIKTNIKNLYKAKNTLTAHAILYLTNQYAKAALKELNLCFTEYKRHCDLAFAENLLPKHNVYFIKPFFYQNDVNKPSVTKNTKNINPNNFLIAGEENVK